MSETEQKTEVVKPKRKAKIEAIVVAEPEVRLGSLGMTSPVEVVKHATELATALAQIIESQQLYSIIKNKKTGEKRKYVRCEGWTTMGAMLGVFPIEDYCRALPNGRGYESKINLVRSKDGMVIGAASAECTSDETQWSGKDSYSLRSMSLTRATSKAFRLSFSWIIKLAGYEPTPAEEMQSQEDASVIREQVEQEVENQKKGSPGGSNGQQRPSEGASLFYALQPSGLYAVQGDKGLMRKIYRQFQAQWQQHAEAFMLNDEQINVLQFECKEGNIPLKQLQGPKA